MTRCMHPKGRQVFVRRDEHPIIGFVHIHRCADCGRESERLVINSQTIASNDMRLFRRAVMQLCIRAVRIGLLERRATCEQCGATGRIQAHHYDYSRPLEVEWLCQRCHKLADSARREYERAA